MTYNRNCWLCIFIECHLVTLTFELRNHECIQLFYKLLSINWPNMRKIRCKMAEKQQNAGSGKEIKKIIITRIEPVGKPYREVCLRSELWPWMAHQPSSWSKHPGTRIEQVLAYCCDKQKYVLSYYFVSLWPWHSYGPENSQGWWTGYCLYTNQVSQKFVQK